MENNEIRDEETMINDGRGMGPKHWKRNLIIAVVIILVSIIAVPGTILVSQYFRDIERVKEIYEEVCEYVERKDFSKALDRIEYFNESHADTDKKTTEKVNDLLDKTETLLYEHIKSLEDNYSITYDCSLYLRYYADGKYADEVEKLKADAQEKIDEANAATAPVLGYFADNDEICTMTGMTDDKIVDLVKEYMTQKDYIDSYGWSTYIDEGDGYGNFILRVNKSGKAGSDRVVGYVVGYQLMGKGGKNIITIHSIFDGDYKDEWISDGTRMAKVELDWGVRRY